MANIMNKYPEGPKCSRNSIRIGSSLGYVSHRCVTLNRFGLPEPLFLINFPLNNFYGNRFNAKTKEVLVREYSPCPKHSFKLWAGGGGGGLGGKLQELKKSS